MVALLVILTFLIFLTLDYIVQRRSARVKIEEGVQADRPVSVKLLSIPRTPLGVYFNPGHTWVYLEESGMARVGITDIARDIVGEVDAAEPLAPGETVKRGEVLLRLRRGKRSAAFRSPIEGVVEKVNLKPVRQGSGDSPSESYAGSWIYKIHPKDTAEIPKRMYLGEAARSWLNHEIERLTVFLATAAPTNPLVGVTARDGGFIAQGLIETLSDSDWEKLQEKFLG